MCTLYRNDALEVALLACINRNLVGDSREEGGRLEVPISIGALSRQGSPMLTHVRTSLSTSCHAFTGQPLLLTTNGKTSSKQLPEPADYATLSPGAPLYEPRPTTAAGRDVGVGDGRGGDGGSDGGDGGTTAQRSAGPRPGQTPLVSAVAHARSTRISVSFNHAQ